MFSKSQYTLRQKFSTRLSLQGRKREDAIKCLGMVVLEMISQSLDVNYVRNYPLTWGPFSRLV